MHHVVAGALPSIGLQHPTVRQFRHVINNTGPARQQLLVAEGLWAHEVVLELDAAVEVALWCPELACSAGSRHCAERIIRRARSAFRVSPKVLERLCERERPDGLLSLVALPTWRADAVPLGPSALILVADGIEIPGNLGTLLRTLDACGADGMILTNRRTRLTHPKVFRGSRGMNLRVPVIEFADPADAAQWLAQRGFAVFLATLGERAVPYVDVDFGARAAIVVGNERYGIAPAWYEPGHTEVTIPMRGLADSLNVSISASILLYEARRGQRQAPGAGGRGTL